MAKNDLNKPLRQKARRRNFRWRVPIAPALISAAVVVAIIAAFWVAVVDDPDGGRQSVVAVIADPAPSETGSVDDAAVDPVPAPPPPLAIEEESIELAALPVVPAPANTDPSLVEPSAHGPIPRTSPDGRRPREAYARRSAPFPDGVPRVVIVVGGLGISQTGTQDAIAQLPQDVTLAFAPYGASLQRWVAEAREEGHELLLQIPMEPENYPQENPGEHTLLASAGNRNDLHWVLSRMTSYAGVMNYLGARFTSEERALVPFLGEIGERGLYYLDDGSSAASRVAAVGEALRVPVVTADRIVDRNRNADAIHAELTALEAIARTEGIAVGVASAFAVSVNAIVSWIDEAEERGVVIVPASAAIAP
jgi:polysaccharide deacetylase 2 family uncharacterized protein YibQ